MAIAISYSPFAVKTKRRWNVIVVKCVFARRRKDNGAETIDEFSTLDVGELVCPMLKTKTTQLKFENSVKQLFKGLPK